jgi:hypothetical protein
MLTSQLGGQEEEPQDLYALTSLVTGLLETGWRDKGT